MDQRITFPLSGFFFPMFSTRSSLLTLGVVILALSALGGCSDQKYVYADEPEISPGAIELSPVPPPAPSDEEKVGYTDPRTQVWRPGHWIYENQRFYWVPGETLTRPSDTAVWSQDRWEHRQYGWAFVHGYWQ